nr:hypothetical protein [uncultured Chryseobacterium sp.]
MGNLKEFALLFRIPKENNRLNSEEQSKIDNQWKKFIALLASQVKLVSVSKLSFDGVIVKHDLTIEHSTFFENGFFVTTNLTMKSETIEDVHLLAKRSPIFLEGGTVEIREITPII